MFKNSAEWTRSNETWKPLFEASRDGMCLDFIYLQYAQTNEFTLCQVMWKRLRKKSEKESM